MGLAQCKTDSLSHMLLPKSRGRQLEQFDDHDAEMTDVEETLAMRT